MRVALFQPEIAGNTGAIMRLCACFGLPLDLIEPLGFVFDDKKLKRAGMDYADQVVVTRHRSWDYFTAQKTAAQRLILLTTKATQTITDFSFQPEDILLFGQESAGVPPQVHEQVEARIKIPLQKEARSLNISLAVALVVGEALRQTNLYPKD